MRVLAKTTQAIPCLCCRHQGWRAKTQCQLGQILASCWSGALPVRQKLSQPRSGPADGGPSSRVSNGFIRKKWALLGQALEQGGHSGPGLRAGMACHSWPGLRAGVPQLAWPQSRGTTAGLALEQGGHSWPGLRAGVGCHSWPGLRAGSLHLGTAIMTGEILDIR